MRFGYGIITIVFATALLTDNVVAQRLGDNFDVDYVRKAIRGVVPAETECTKGNHGAGCQLRHANGTLYVYLDAPNLFRASVSFPENRRDSAEFLLASIPLLFAKFGAQAEQIKEILDRLISTRLNSRSASSEKYRLGSYELECFVNDAPQEVSTGCRLLIPESPRKPRNDF